MLWLLFGRSFGWDDGLSYEQMLLRNINTTPLYTIKTGVLWQASAWRGTPRGDIIGFVNGLMCFVGRGLA